MADSSRAQLYYVEESAWGVTPAAALEELRFTGESLKQATSTTVSDEIRADRQVTDVKPTAVRAEGDVSFELSYGTYDKLLAGVMMSAWVTDGGGAGVDLLENGTTLKSFTLEKKFADVGEFMSFTGMRPGTFSLTAANGRIVTGSIGFVGKSGAAAGATVGTGAAVAASTTPVMDAVGNISAITEGGGAFADVMSIALTIENNLRAQPALGSLPAIGVGLGRVVVTGTVEAYFRSRALYQKYLSFTTSSLAFTLTDALGNSYTFTIPKLRYTDGDVVAGGNDQDVLVRLPFQAIRDAATDATIQITRNPA